MHGNWLLGSTGLMLIAFVGCQHNMQVNNADTFVEQKASLNDSQVADMQMAMGTTMESHGQGQQALTVYEEAVKKDPRRADGWVRLAVLSDKEAKFTESGEYYQKALALEPRNANIHCNLGYSLYLQNRFTEAEAALRRAIEIQPDHQRALNNLGLVLAKSGRSEESLEAFQRAGNNVIDARCNLAYGLMSQGMFVEAREQYELALKLDPASGKVRKWLDDLAAVTPKTAETMPAKAITVPVVEPSPITGLVALPNSQ